MVLEYDFLIVGCGIYGAVCAHELTKKGYKCLVIDKRNHIGGNCYTEKIQNINVHKYGPHIFHTSNERVWNYMNQFVKFNTYRHHAVANYKNEIYSLPFNMFTFNKLWGVTTPKEAKDKIDSQKYSGDPKNFEEQAIYNVGFEIYEKLIKGYTKKQWMKDPKSLPSSIIKRIPVRFTFDNNYFFDKYQGIPENGYTEFFEKLLHNVEVKLNVDYFSDREYYDNISEHVIFTGQIDRYFNYKFGDLEYRPLEFQHETHNMQNYQGHSIVNYTDESIPYTRIVEHRHFENSESDVTIITKEYPIEWDKNREPYYPINDENNNKIYSKYFQESQKLNKVYFGGRLAEYKYYDMHQVVESALNLVDKFNEKK